MAGFAIGAATHSVLSFICILHVATVHESPYTCVDYGHKRWVAIEQLSDSTMCRPEPEPSSAHRGSTLAEPPSYSKLVYSCTTTHFILHVATVHESPYTCVDYGHKRWAAIEQLPDFTMCRPEEEPSSAARSRRVCIRSTLAEPPSYSKLMYSCTTTALNVVDCKRPGQCIDQGGVVVGVWLGADFTC